MIEDKVCKLFYLSRHFHYSPATYDPRGKGNKGGKFFNLPKFVIAGENQTEPGGLTELARGQSSEELKHLQSVWHGPQDDGGMQRKSSRNRYRSLLKPVIEYQSAPARVKSHRARERTIPWSC